MNEKQHILLVEDDLVDAMTVKRAFKELEIPNPIIHLSNGEEALKYLMDPKKINPGIILLDLNMPRMNGIEFLEKLKNENSFKSIPVIILTTSTEYQNRKNSFQQSAAGYMVKPVNYRDFIDMMKTISSYWTKSELS